MARVFGQSGGYARDEASRQRRRIRLVVLVGAALFSFIAGVAWSAFLPVPWMSDWNRRLILPGALLGIWLMDKWGRQKLDRVETKYDLLFRGADGEKKVANELANFPDKFYVINGFPTPSGDIDHIVVGPTGVFVLDTKDWRGVVSADGMDELLLNGRQTDTPFIRQFSGRMLGLRNRVKDLAPDLEPVFQAMFVFTAARVEAKWGMTGSVHCLTDDRLRKYIVEGDFGRRLPAHAVRRIARAFLVLAHRDPDLAEEAGE